MVRIIVLVAAMLLVPLASKAQGSDIEAVISAQIEAFKQDDFAGAFEYASPAIRDIFRNPENFGNMVRQGYPMVWRPGEVAYGDLREIAGRLWQRVQIADAKGVVHLLDYQMIEHENGWKINAVQLLDSAVPNV